MRLSNRIAMTYLGLTGEVYRTYTLVRVDRGEWRIPGVPGWRPRRFASRDEARQYVDARILDRQQFEDCGILR